ncbi:MAG: EF-P beta-lysylation protein EpmB [Planctomycetota bacterium]|nr:MAG: EF-P beta-lysylation protein EpmB [Planctomycetota bacterium]
MSIVENTVNSSPAIVPPARDPRQASWQDSVKDAVRDPVELCRLLSLPNSLALAAARVAGNFPLFAPREYIARMRPGDVGDPLLRQVLPLEDEQADVPGFASDPVGDGAATRTAGLLHKYHSRALMVTTGACAVHCRYCFRRHFPYAAGPKSPAQWAEALKEISADGTLSEIILSGGDPLMLVDAHLQELARRLAAIPHVRRLRIHTRLPLMIPSRVDDALIAWLRGTRLTPVVVIHANHARELEGPAVDALARLADAGVPLLNQSVLLRGVNDDLDTLAELCERLVDLRVIPYYLHQLDRVTGAAHFEVDEKRGHELVERLRSRLPGYAVPRYVRETAGAASKTLLA